MDLEPKDAAAASQTAPPTRRAMTYAEVAQQVAVDLSTRLDGDGPKHPGQGAIGHLQAVSGRSPKPKVHHGLAPLVTGAALAASSLIGGVGIGVYVSTYPIIFPREHISGLWTSIQSIVHSSPRPPLLLPARIQPSTLAPLTPLPSLPQAARSATSQASIAVGHPPVQTQQLVPAVGPPPLHWLRNADVLAGLMAVDCDKTGGCDPGAVLRAQSLAEDTYDRAIKFGVPTTTLSEVRHSLDTLAGDNGDTPVLLVGNYVLAIHDTVALVARARAAPRHQLSAGTSR